MGSLTLRNKMNYINAFKKKIQKKFKKKCLKVLNCTKNINKENKFLITWWHKLWKVLEGGECLNNGKINTKTISDALISQPYLESCNLEYL